MDLERQPIRLHPLDLLSAADDRRDASLPDLHKKRHCLYGERLLQAFSSQWALPLTFT
jgi:hypothetical protein